MFLPKVPPLSMSEIVTLFASICIQPPVELSVQYSHRMHMQTCAQVVHAAVALMDATVAAGGTPSPDQEGVFVAACMRIAAHNERAPVPPEDQTAALFGTVGVAQQRMLNWGLISIPWAQR